MSPAARTNGARLARSALLILAAALATGCGDSPTGPSAPDRLTAVFAGMSHSCVLDENGRAFCWGDDRFGQLGVGLDRGCRGEECRRPLPVPGDLLWSDLALGELHSCGVSDSRLYCWGINRFGQLGNDRLVPEHCQLVPAFKCAVVPRRASLGTPVVSVVANGAHSCAVDRDGITYCWGRNLGMQLGTGDTDDRVVPTRVFTILRFVTLGTGEAHTCGIDLDGVAHCWGYGANGRLGVGDSQSRETPARVGGNQHSFRWSSISVGHAHTCGIESSGTPTVHCWGLGNQGQIGRGDRVSRVLPLPVGLPEEPAMVSAGGYHNCAVTVAGGLLCWGANDHGQLGIASSDARRLRPVRVPLPEPVATVSAGFEHTCAITTSDALYCWGRNQFGQLGDGTEQKRFSPVRIEF